MHPTNEIEREDSEGRASAWRVVRWGITAAAALLLVTLFLTQATSTEAAAPTTYTDTVKACLDGNYNFCGYNVSYNYNWGYGMNGVNWAYPSFVAPAYVFPTVANVGWWNNCVTYLCNNFVGNNGWWGGWPGWVGANNCPSGNFSACFGGNCAVGNFACLNANVPWWWNTGAQGVGVPTVGTNGGTKTIASPVGGTIVIFNPKEVAPEPVAAPVAAQPAPVAAPVAAPAANMATALNAPVAAPVAAPDGGGSGVHIFSASPATTPAVTTTDGDDHRG